MEYKRHSCETIVKVNVMVVNLCRVYKYWQPDSEIAMQGRRRGDY